MTSLKATFISSSNVEIRIMDNYFTPFKEKATMHSMKLLVNIVAENYLRKFSVKVALAAIIIKSLLSLTLEHIKLKLGQEMSNNFSASSHTNNFIDLVTI
jgi:hypothetical protein